MNDEFIKRFMNTKSVKRAIKRKFGSMSEFARQSGIARIELQVVLNSKTPHKKRLAAINAKATRLRVRPSKGVVVPQKLDRLKRAIMKAGGVVTFCRENSGFSVDSVFHILQGKRKRMAGVTKSLFEHFGIE